MPEVNILSADNADSINWNIRDELKGLSLQEILEVQPRLPYAVCMINTTGSLNVGVALRSAVLFGAEKFYIVGRRRYDKRSTVGAQNYIEVERIDCMDENYAPAIEKIKADGYLPNLIETGFPDISVVRDIKLDHKPCIILGEEKDGIPDDILDMGFVGYSIPQLGVLRSLNVSVAGAIAMYEFSNNLKVK